MIILSIFIFDLIGFYFICSKLNVVFRYDASNSNNSRVFESRPEGTSTGSKVEWVRRTPDPNQHQRAAALSDGLSAIHGLNIVNIIHSIGGAVMLLSLLKNVDPTSSALKMISRGNTRPSSPATQKKISTSSNTINFSSKDGGGLSEVYTSKYIYETISLICDCLRRSATFQEEFYHIHGYQVINIYFRSYTTKFLTKDVISSLVSLVQASQGIRGRPERALYCSAVLDSLFFFSLWRQLTGELLVYISMCCLEIIKWEPIFIRDYIIDIPVLMHTLKTLTR